MFSRKTKITLFYATSLALIGTHLQNIFILLCICWLKCKFHHSFTYCLVFVRKNLQLLVRINMSGPLEVVLLFSGPPPADILVPLLG